MPTTFTPSLRLTLQVTGDNNGTWGTVTNSGVIDLIDTAIAGTQSISVGSTDVTLTNNNGVADTSRAMILSLAAGAGVGARNIICPSFSKLYVVYNNTGYTQTIKTAAGPDVVAVPTGQTAFVRCDGVSVFSAANYVPALTVGQMSGTTFAGNAHTTPVVVAYSATAMVVDCSLANVFTTTLTGNVTTAPTFSNLKDGQTINWFLTQDSTGARTMTWPASFKWPSGFVTTLSTSANAVDLVTATYRSATGFWYVTLLKAFV